MLCGVWAIRMTTTSNGLPGPSEPVARASIRSHSPLRDRGCASSFSIPRSRLLTLPERTNALAREVLGQRKVPVSAVSCVGVGSGSGRWSEEELRRLEVGVVGAFARGCHDAGIAQFCLLSAAGSSATSWLRYARVMGMKEDTVRKIGFTRLAIFRPGIIVGNAHTPAGVGWLGGLVPGPFGSIDQQILGRSIAAEIALHSGEVGEVIRENAAMKKLAAQFHSVL